MSVCDSNEVHKNKTKDLDDLPEGVPQLNTFYLYLSNSCNLACRHCWIVPRFIDGQPDPGDTIDFNHLQDAIIEAKPLGLNRIKLTGGEPLLHPDFKKIVSFITHQDLSLFMETNGTLITRQIARFLKNKSNMEHISISIDGKDSFTHDSFRGVDGAFDRAIQGIDHLVAAGYDNVQVIMSVHRSNLEQIENVVRLAANHGAASVKFNPVLKSGRGIEMERHNETLKFHERMELSKYISEDLAIKLQGDRVQINLILYNPPALSPINELFHHKGQTGNCGVLNILGILGSGEIALCGIGLHIPELTYGYLGQHSIRDIWLNHPTILQLRKNLNDINNYPGICGECKLARLCRTGCVAQNYLDNKKLVSADLLCEKAQQLNHFPETRKNSKVTETN